MNKKTVLVLMKEPLPFAFAVMPNIQEAETLSIPNMAIAQQIFLEKRFS